MTVGQSYKRNYDQIARDHIAFWKETGRNPFQEEGTLARNENAVVEIAQRYLTPESIILDAGCGMGDLLLRFPEHESYGIDLSADYVEIAQERGLRVEKGWIERLPWPRAFFDVVFCTDVLEHVLDVHSCVRELLRVLKPGGVLIVRAPNEEALPVETPPYEFVHLRRFDDPTFRLLFGKIFQREVLEVLTVGEVIYVVVRK